MPYKETKHTCLLEALVVAQITGAIAFFAVVVIRRINAIYVHL
jgi:hypothetical protein